MSHDLRTPLTSIGGWAEALADGAAPDPAAAGETIRVAAARLDRLVQDLLDLARLRARAFTLLVAPVDLRDVAAGTLEGLRPELEDSGLAVSMTVPAAPVVVDGDPDRLAQVIANLLDNAGRHAAARVHLEVRLDPDHVLVVVDDDGPGIPATERPAVFERLHTSARPAARAGTGTGLGLAIVARSWPTPWAATPPPPTPRRAAPGSWSPSRCRGPDQTATRDAGLAGAVCGR